ncbi:MAG: hypothetical protein H6574_20810 [Lewinellaceae bacterium]|nr:hypothetical protein [Lewinellaceae bacterium]
MKNELKFKTWEFSHISQWILLFGLLIPGITVNAQNGNLLQDGAMHKISSQGDNYLDLTVPQPGSSPYLSLNLRGADGGKGSIHDIFGKITRVGRGGQGAAVSAVFKIGNGNNELLPGSKIRIIVGNKGGDEINQDNLTYLSRKGGGGGGTGVLYLPVGSDTTNPNNWKILIVAGGGGGGWAAPLTASYDGRPGHVTKNAFGDTDGGSLIPGRSGYGGADMSGGGGTNHDFSHLIIDGVQALNGDASCDVYTRNLPYSGKGLFTIVSGKILPTGGKGGSANTLPGSVNTGGGGFGCGGGGGRNQWSAGGGGGYSGGMAGMNGTDTYNRGGGGGSFILSTYALAGSSIMTQNDVTDNASDGYVDYQCFATNPVVTRDLFFEAHKGTEVQVLKTGNWTLLWQYDGNLVLYGEGGKVGWASNTQNKGTDLYFQGDGNLVIYQSGNPVWASNTANNQKAGKGGRKLVLTPEGSLYIVDQDAKVIWQGH